MNYVELLDDTAWPIIYARFRGTASVEAFDVYARWYEGQLARARTNGTKLVSISDTTPGVTVSSEVRRHITQWMTALQDTNGGGLGDYVVVDGAIIRGVMTAMSWVAGSRMGGVTSVRTVDAAWDGAVKKLTEAGIAPPTKKPGWIKARPT